MMTRIRAALVLGFCAGAAVAQSTADQPPRDFATAKAQITARLQKELACVEAATSQEALHACRPHPPGGHPPGPPPQDN
jgi:hypothetical protein